MKQDLYRIVENKKLTDKDVNYFANDLVHLNKHGYDCLEELLKETIYD